MPKKVMDGNLLRWLGTNRYCVEMRDTGAVLCLECAFANLELNQAAPFCPIGVTVKLGEYSTEKGCFKDCSIVAPVLATRETRTTAYKKVKI